MSSISYSKNLISGVELVDSNLILPHEKVINKKTTLLIDYLNTFNESIIISSILCCSKNMVIIDGHHRFFALKKIGFKKIPVTKLDYFSTEIKTDLNEKYSKKDIICSGINKEFLEPKSTYHIVYCKKSKNWEPVILLSSLFNLKF